MRIAVTSPSFSKNVILRQELLNYFPDSCLNELGNKLENDQLIAFIKDFDGIIVGLERLDEKILRECKNLKIISKFGVGLDNVDIECCERKNIKIGWIPGVNKLSVAEMTIAFMIALIRNLFFTSAQLKNGLWNKNGGFNLSGKTIGIIGVGNVGREVVRLLKPFNCEIMVNDIVDQGEYYAKNDLIETSKEDIYKKADIITLHTPLTEKTKHMINKETIALMGSNVFIINTARGAIVETEDLKWALMKNLIAGAAIDVYSEEPPGDEEFLRLPNLICTPHIGGNSYESVLTMGRSAIKHLRDYFER